MRRDSRLTLPVLLLGALLTNWSANGEMSPGKLWSEFNTTRQALPGFQQEFEITRKFKTERVEQASHHQVIIDVSKERWREQSTGGAGLVRIFDGQNLFLTEPEGTEYVRLKSKENEEPLPEPYGTKLDWRKAKEIQRVPCGFREKDHSCVVIEVPIKMWVRQSPVGGQTRMSNGIGRVMIDTETGIWLQCHTVEVVESSRTSYQLDVTYALRRMSYGAADPSVFRLPESGLREVKQLTPWNEARIKKQLIGKPAPELQVADIQGNPVSLADLKGKTVLLDFWTTWCPPCQNDGPAIDKLNQKYGGKDLMIIAISVDEERETVEKFLKKHPHSYPVVLSSENQLPRPYQIGVFPTYLIIGPNGMLTSAEEGDQGFGKLRKILEKAGMATD